MKYSYIVGASQVLAAAHGGRKSQKAERGKRDIEKVEHEPFPYCGDRLKSALERHKASIRMTGGMRKGKIKEMNCRHAKSCKSPALPLAGTGA